MQIDMRQETRQASSNEIGQDNDNDNDENDVIQGVLRSSKDKTEIKSESVDAGCARFNQSTYTGCYLCKSSAL